MKRRTGVGRVWAGTAVALSAILAFAACKSSSTTPSSSTTIGGVVTDSTGAVLSGVKVSVGTAATTTKANGTFAMTVAPQTDLVVDFSKPGYLESSRALIATAGTNSRVSATLMAMAAAQPLDATKGGTVTGARGARSRPVLVPSSTPTATPSRDPWRSRLRLSVRPFLVSSLPIRARSSVP
jgi:hypothetical protein